MRTPDRTVTGVIGITSFTLVNSITSGIDLTNCILIMFDFWIFFGEENATDDEEGDDAGSEQQCQQQRGLLLCKGELSFVDTLKLKEESWQLSAMVSSLHWRRFYKDLSHICVTKENDVLSPFSCLIISRRGSFMSINDASLPEQRRMIRSLSLSSKCVISQWWTGVS